MDKTKELIEKINENPDRKLIFMYPDEGSEHSYTMGYPKKIIVDEYWIDDDRVWFKNEEREELLDHYGEIFADDMYDKFPLTSEQDIAVDNKLKEFIDNIKWKKCIAVYIHYL